MTDSVFDAYSRYYDLLYHDSYDAEVVFILDVLRRNGLVEGSLLEFGSGTGKHGCLLAANNFTVHGIELSSTMVAQARSANGFSCEQGDITAVNKDRVYDAVLSLFHVISYQISNEKLLAVFFNAARHLNSGGLFVFDFWYTEF